MINVTNVARCRGEMAQIIGRLQVCLLNRLRMTPSIMAPIDFGWKCIDFQKVVLERLTNQS
ncbi:hypothetical protein BLOT_013386 [Blomia tropicalis]|nr:hypothetical protein BLOT_013386 [Blomia tropicalis]